MSVPGIRVMSQMKVTYPYVKVNINFNTDQSQTGLIPQTGFDIIEIAFNMQNKTISLKDTIAFYVFVTDGIWLKSHRLTHC